MKRHLAIETKKIGKSPIAFNIFLALFLIISNWVTAQQTTVSGLVTGDNGTPLNSVSVTIKGTTRGTSTNTSGRFTISVPSNATLVFSSVGYTNKEVGVAGRSTVDVSLV